MNFWRENVQLSAQGLQNAILHDTDLLTAYLSAFVDIIANISHILKHIFYFHYWDFEFKPEWNSPKYSVDYFST